MKRILLLAFMLLPASSALALITEPLSGEVFIGPATGEMALGSFTYDETLITGVGDEEIDAIDGLLVELTFVGKTFFETDDIDFDSFPILGFEDGLPVFLDFVVDDTDGVGTEIDDPRMDGFFMIEIIPDPVGGFFGEIFTFIIPEPSALALMGLGLCMWGARTRRR